MYEGDILNDESKGNMRRTNEGNKQVMEINPIIGKVIYILKNERIIMRKNSYWYYL